MEENFRGHRCAVGIGAEVFDVDGVPGQNLRNLAHDADTVVADERQRQTPSGFGGHFAGCFGGDAQSRKLREIAAQAEADIASA